MNTMVSLAMLAILISPTLLGGIPLEPQNAPGDSPLPPQVCFILPSTKPHYRILAPPELLSVQGGLSIGGGGGNSSTSKLVNIPLNNVPYINQNISGNQRSAYYCGLASALMVRTKEKFGYAALTILNTPTYMTTMDNYLLNNIRYGYSYDLRNNGWAGYPGDIDVEANKGLLYINRYNTREIQYKKTRSILSGIYTANGNDGIIDTHRVTAVDVTITRSSEISDTIWNHIKTFKQPVVAIVDSNIMNYMRNNNKPPDVRDYLTLHYIVIKGIRENSVWMRFFSVYDSANTIGMAEIEYNSAQLAGLMTMIADKTQAWVYEYPKQELWIPNPCYSMLVYGN